jgi:hypothetical protein
VRVAPAASVALVNPTVSALLRWLTLLMAVNRKVSVQIRAARGEQATGTLTQVEPCVTAATRVSMILTAVWAGILSKPLVAVVIAPSPESETWQRRWWLASAGLTRCVAAVAPAIGAVSASHA